MSLSYWFDQGYIAATQEKRTQCHIALVAAVMSEDEIEPVIDRLFVEFEGLKTKEQMRQIVKYTRAAQETRQLEGARANDIVCCEAMLARPPEIIDRLKRGPVDGSQ